MKNIICPPKIDFPKMNKMTNSFLKILFCTRDFKFKDRSFPIMMENTNTNTNDKSFFAKEADQICSNNDSSASNYTRRNASKKKAGVQKKQIISQRISCETCSSHPTICTFLMNERKSFESSQDGKCHRGPSSPDKKSYLVPSPHSLTTSFDLLSQWREIAINYKGINN